MNISSGTWVEPSYLLLGDLSGAISESDRDIFLGNFLGAQAIRTSDYAMLAVNGTVSATTSNIFANSNAIINAGVIWTQGSDDSFDTTAIGGSFTLSQNIINVAILENGTWSGINTTIQGQVQTLAAINNLLFIGGSFNASSSGGGHSSSFLVYDVQEQKTVASGGFSGMDRWEIWVP